MGKMEWSQHERRDGSNSKSSSTVCDQEGSEADHPSYKVA